MKLQDFPATLSRFRDYDMPPGHTRAKPLKPSENGGDFPRGLRATEARQSESLALQVRPGHVNIH
jgi:hypothetical protein